MNVQAMLNKLESWAQQELQAQRRLLELLDAQQEAIDSGSGAAIAAAGEEIQDHLRTGPAREKCRLEVMRQLAHTWGVAVETLTLRSIVERAEAAGVATGRLQALRGELRDAGSSVLRAGRRIAVMARYHQGLLAEVFGLLLREGHPGSPVPREPEGEGGVLLNQRA